MKNYHIWEEYTGREDLPIIRVEDIVFSSKYGEDKIAKRSLNYWININTK